MHSSPKNVFARLKNAASFFKAILINPRAMGTICPSTHYLANEMASQIPLDCQGIIIELGAGTGVVTEALLAHGIDPKRIIVIDQLPSFVAKLRQRFPMIKVIEGDAIYLTQFLKDTSGVEAVVSSLPLLSLPKAAAEIILGEISQVLSPGGLYIQYTYSYKENKFETLKSYKKIHSKRIWRNIPPARVDVFRAP